MSNDSIDADDGSAERINSRRRRVLQAAGVTLAGSGVLGSATAQSEGRSVDGSAGDGASGDGSATNVVLMIADGLSPAIATAARLRAVGPNGERSYDNLPYTGDMTTHAAGSLVTDSAASATAMATGEKTNNGYVGVNPRGETLRTILEMAQDEGMRTGLVSTSYLTDATTAAFAAHNTDRHKPEPIAAQMLAHRPEVMMGGGENHFLPEGESGRYSESGIRTDGHNLIEEAQDAGYEYIATSDEFGSLDSTSERVLGLFGDSGLYPDLYSEDSSNADPPSLAEMTALSLDVLSRDDEGFFLVVEEEGTDEFAHDNDAAATVDSMDGFAAAVDEAREFADTRGDTLVIVTGDHECGGSAVMAEDGQGPFETPEGREFYVDFLTTSHTGEAIPIGAEGPGAEGVLGVLDNTDVFDLMTGVLGV